jgi:hypothetical protein
MPKPKKPRKGTLAALAEESRKQAEAAPLIFDPELTRIKQTYSVPEIVEMIQQVEKKPKRGPGRPKGKSPHTIFKLKLIARLQADDLTLYAIAKKLKMDYGALRKFLHKNRQK